MKKIVFLFILISTATLGYSYNIIYLEQFYKLYSDELYSYPHDVSRNIYYLKAALGSDFCNPLYALAKINTKEDWEKYRYLMYTHINLKLVDSYLELADGLDKQVAYFYNAPWKDKNIKSLDRAEKFYIEAKRYWLEAIYWSDLASQDKFRFLFLEDIQFFEDESFMIQTGELNYMEIIEKHLTRLNRVRREFEEMDENTY